MARTRCEVRFSAGDGRGAVVASAASTRRSSTSRRIPGRICKPLARIASGGELSRVMLALKTLASTDAPGQDADLRRGRRRHRRRGRRRRRRAAAAARRRRSRSCASRTCRRSPRTARRTTGSRRRVQGGRTSTDVARVDGAEREEELARMIGGADVSAAVLASAREMLERDKRKPERQGESEDAKSAKAKAKRSHAKAKAGLEMARRYLIETFGCQMNVHDSERMAGLLEQAGYEPTDDDRDADVIVINTCSVRETAEEKLYTRLGEIRVLGEETGHAPGRRRRRLRRAAGRRAAPASARTARHRRHRRHAEPEAAADAGRRSRARSRAPRRRESTLDPVRRRVVSAGDCAARAIRSRPTSRSSKAATSSARSASCRTRAATSGCGRWPTSWRTSGTRPTTGRREVQLLGQIVNHYQAPDDPALRLRGAARARQRRRRARAHPLRQPASAPRRRRA